MTDIYFIHDCCRIYRGEPDLADPKEYGDAKTILTRMSTG